VLRLAIEILTDWRFPNAAKQPSLPTSDLLPNAPRDCLLRRICIFPNKFHLGD
jgi:hypothetical protein